MRWCRFSFRNFYLALLGFSTLLLSIFLSTPALSQNRQPLDEIAPDELVAVPVTLANRSTVDMPMLVYRPSKASDKHTPVLIFSHGRAPSVMDRANLSRPANALVIRFWTERDYAVVAPIRPGYGESVQQLLGHEPEDHSARWPERGGPCTGRADFTVVTKATDSAITAAHQWVVAQPWADANRLILAGVSVGGLASTSACTLKLPGVKGCINFVGGAGGNPRTSPEKSCQPERLEELYGELGAQTALPSLWIYARNDQYWGRQAPINWHAMHSRRAREAQLPHEAEFHMLPAIGQDGHTLIRNGESYWRPLVEAWLLKYKL